MCHLHHVYFSFPPRATPSFSMFLLTNEKIADFGEKLLQRKDLTNNPGDRSKMEIWQRPNQVPQRLQ